MIGVELKSRAGNQMFQLATAYHLAKVTNQELVLKENGSPDYTKYPIILEGRNTIKDIHGFHIVEEPLNQSLVNLEEITKGKENILLKGYFQSDKYFTREDAETLFPIPDDIKEKYASFEGLCCISVRRGDYVSLNGFICPSIKWYKHCYKKYFDGMQIVVASDDIPWCKEHINFGTPIFLDASPIETLFAKAMCKHHIIPPSSYNWWSAYLSGEDSVVVAPTPWFNGQLSHLNQEDKYCKNWIKEELI